MAVTHRSKSATIRSSTAQFNRFLKPGALARLRDSRINNNTAASKVYANSLICAESNGVEQQFPQIDESFMFTMRTFGPRFLNRKKLGARKSSFAVPVTAAGSAVVSETMVVAVDVAAH